MPRYVLLQHDWPVVHYDLMLQTNYGLLSWRMKELITPGQQVVEHTANHRLAYLDYEGPVSRNRGTVKKMAAGRFQFIKRDFEDYELHMTGDLEGHMTLQAYQPDSLERKVPVEQRINAYSAPWLLVWTPS